MRTSRSTSVAASHPVRMYPLFVRTFPVIVYDDPLAVGASLTHIRSIITFPVHDSAPLWSCTRYVKASIPHALAIGVYTTSVVPERTATHFVH